MSISPRAMYYFSVHLLYASIVGCAAWVLTSVRGASATTNYWIWVVTVFNFVVPVGRGDRQALGATLGVGRTARCYWRAGVAT